MSKQSYFFALFVLTLLLAVAFIKNPIFYLEKVSLAENQIVATGL